MDAWHGILISAIGSLAATIAVLWRANVKLRSQLDSLHDDHKTDIRELTQSALKLGLSVIARVQPLAGSSESPTGSPSGRGKLEP